MAVTVPTEQRSVSYVGNAVADTFPVPFEFREDEHLVINLVLISSGAATLQVLGVDYTCNGAGQQQGEVVFTAAPSALYTVSIARTVPVTQDLDLRQAGPFNPDSITGELDHCREIDQQLQDRIAALEALASLLDISALTAVRVNISFTCPDVGDGWAGAVAALPIGFVPTMVLVGKVVGGAGGQDSVMVRDWTVDGTTLTPGFITGLDPGVDYDISLLLLAIA